MTLTIRRPRSPFLTALASLAAAAVAVSLAFASSAFAISETDYAATYAARVAPFFATGEDGSFDGIDRVKLRYRKFEVPSDQEDFAVVIVNGRAETFLKYAELVHDLRALTHGRASFYLYDHRGQGLSARLIRNSQKGFVHSFGDYVDDLDIFVNQVVRARPHRKLVLIGHSMGATIGALYMALNPATFASAVLSSPMFELNTGKYSGPLAYAIATAATFTGQGAAWARGEGAWFPERARFAANGATHSEARFLAGLEVERAQPDTLVGGVTYRWLREAILGGAAALAAARLVHPRVLMLQAGADLRVKPAAQDAFCAALGRRCVKRAFSASGHEILREQDTIRDAALREIAKFLRSGPPFSKKVGTLFPDPAR